MKTFPHRCCIFFLVGIALLSFLLPVAASATEALISNGNIPLTQMARENLAGDDMDSLIVTILEGAAAGVLVYTIMNDHPYDHKDDHS